MTAPVLHFAVDETAYDRASVAAVRKYSKMTWQSALTVGGAFLVFALVLGATTGSSVGVAIMGLAAIGAVIRVTYWTAYNQMMLTPVRRTGRTGHSVDFVIHHDAIETTRDGVTRRRTLADFDRWEPNEAGVLLRKRDDKTLFFVPVSTAESEDRARLLGVLERAGVSR